MMKLKGSKIAIIAIIVIVIALIYLYMTNKKNADQPGKGLTIVTPMPVSGYSIGDLDDGFPESLPDSLPDVTTVPAMEDDVITDAPSMAPEAQVEEFSTYAPKNWRGNVL